MTDDWGPAANLGPNINTAGWDYGPCVTADGKTLYFHSDSLPSGEGIAKSVWSGTEWGPAQELSENVNWSFAEAPSISADGLTLYYSRSLIQGKQIYVSYWDGQDWTPGQFLTEANDTTGAAGPQISYDNRTLYFYSVRTQGSYGGVDIWMIRR